MFVKYLNILLLFTTIITMKISHSSRIELVVDLYIPNPCQVEHQQKSQCQTWLTTQRPWYSYVLNLYCVHTSQWALKDNDTDMPELNYCLPYVFTCLVWLEDHRTDMSGLCSTVHV